MVANESTFTTNSPEETRALAARLVADLPAGTVIALHGDLGAGKTCFVQGLAKALGITDPITSPTYTLVHEYDVDPPLFHLDLYRTTSPEEVLNFGLDEYVEAGGITIIEWAERAGDLLPLETIHIHIVPGEAETERSIHILSPGGAP